MKKVSQSKFLSVLLSVTVSVFSVAAIGYAATTISTNVNTGGTLTVTGTSTLTGDISAAGNLALTGASATTTITGGLRADSADNTFVVDFSSSKIGVGTTSPAVLLSVHGSVILGSANSDTLSIRSGTWSLDSTATTTIGISTGTNSTNGINVNSGALVFDALNSKLYVGTSTPIKGNFAVASSGTTTLVIDSTAAAAAGSAGGCIEMKAIGGSLVHLSATSTPITGSVAVWYPGSCSGN